MSRERSALQRDIQARKALVEKKEGLLKQANTKKSKPKTVLNEVFDLQKYYVGYPFDNLPILLRHFKEHYPKKFSETKLRRLCEVLVNTKAVGLLEEADLLRGVFMASMFLSKAIRNVDDWVPKSHNRSRQLSELVHYLYVQYPMPRFFDSAFMLRDVRYMAWFVHIAQGKSVRKFKEMPIPMTAKMAHIFLQAPPQYSVIEALRYAQILANGGDEYLAYSILGSRMVEDFENNAFWETVLRFFINNPMLDKVEVLPLIDYIHHVKFGVQSAPDFSMKGRTVTALLRQMTDWHNQVNRLNRNGKFDANATKWTPVPISNFEHAEGTTEAKRKVYSIYQLTTAKALQTEGAALSHCVYSYTRSCMSGKTSIWSFAEEVQDNVTRLLTLEMNNTERMIVQIRGKYNRYPTEQEMKVVDRWAAREYVKISRWAAPEVR
jgi:hypothetical protein